MKRDKQFHAVMGTLMVGLVAIVIWWRAEWSAVQIGCFVVILLVGGALWVNNHRNEAFHNAAFIPLATAIIVFSWMDTRTLLGCIVRLPFTLFVVWLALKPYYLKWKKSRNHVHGSSEPHVGLEVKSNG